MRLILLAFAGLESSGTALAQEAQPRAAEPSGADLAKQLSNPVANLISVPLQNNFDCCYGPEGAGRYTLNIQPVIPMSLTRDWNVIIRTIVPIISQGETIAGEGSASGLGDTVQSFFFSPKAVKNGLVWAVGPVFHYPTGTSGLGTKRWGAGPTALILKQARGNVTVGMLMNHIWSIGGSAAHPSFSNTLLQPFLAKSLPDSTTFTINSETVYDWKAKTWLVPVNLSVTHIVRIGRQRIQMGPTARYYVSSPSGGPEWGARFTVTLLFPG